MHQRPAPGGIDRDGLFMGGGVGLLGSQAIGVVGVGAFTLAFSFLAWGILKAAGGIRVDRESETVGLDESEIGMMAYPGDVSRAVVLSSGVGA